MGFTLFGLDSTFWLDSTLKLYREHKSSCRQGSSRTNLQVLVLVLVLEPQVLVLVLEP